MKSSLLLVAVCALAVSPLGAEETKERPKGPPGGGPPGGPREFFRNADKDGDKAISKEEAGEHWERLSRLDKDNDGKVTGEEMAAGRPDGPGRGGPGNGGPGALFARADKNKDGKITEDEVPAEGWARLSKLDKNEDGAIDPEEAKAGRPGGPGGDGPPGRGKGGEFFQHADKNSDGKISQDELPEGAWERFARHDKDNDGAVSKAELAAAFAGMRGGPGSPRDRPGGKGAGRGGGPEAMFSRYDENDDGKLGESEVPGEMWDKLRRADTDADGLVSKDELGKVYSERERERPDAPPAKKPEEKKTEA